jgi:hypothetical protein
MDKPRLDQGEDYERGFIDGMMYQTETTVNRAVDAMAKRTWIGLTNEELTDLFYNTNLGQQSAVGQAIELLRERNT